MTKTKLSSTMFGGSIWSHYRTTNKKGQPVSDDKVLFERAFFSRSSKIVYGDDYRSWRDRIRNQEQTTTSMTAEGIKISGLYQGSATVKWTQNQDPANPLQAEQRIYGELGIPMSSVEIPSAVSPVPSDVARVHNAVTMAFVQKALAAQRTFQGGVFIGELKEVLHAIRHPAQAFSKGLGEYLRDCRKIARDIRRRSGTRRSKKDMANQFRRIASDTWLEYAFGWSPLVNDIDDACKTLSQLLYYRPESKFIVSRSSSVTGSERQFAVNTIQTYVIMSRNYQLTNEYSEKLYGVVSLDNGITVGGTSSINLQPVGLDLRSFLPTIYELIPWSFLVDYFTNLNEIVEAACFNRASVKWMALGTRAGRSCTFVSGRFRFSSFSGLANPQLPPFPPNVSFKASYQKISRAPYTGSLIPSLEFQLPGFGKKAVNIAALANSNSYTKRRVNKIFTV